jgi:hypothetical protein
VNLLLLRLKVKGCLRGDDLPLAQTGAAESLSGVDDYISAGLLGLIAWKARGSGKLLREEEKSFRCGTEGLPALANLPQHLLADFCRECLISVCSLKKGVELFVREGPAGVEEFLSLMVSGQVVQIL